MKIIGLTGGIGSGKSTVSSYLKEKNFTVSDADKIAHEILEPQKPALARLVDVFGKEILDENGNLKRKHLASIAFTNKENEKKLNEITHGEIKDEMIRQIKKAKDDGEKLMFLDIPLLFEQGLDKWCDVTWVVTADEEIRINRVVSRDNTTEEDVKARMACQMLDDEKIALADEVLDNSFGIEELYQKIEELLVKYED